MYKKAAGLLILLQFIFGAGCMVIRLSDMEAGRGVKSICQIQLDQILLADESFSTVEIAKTMHSEQRVVTYTMLEREKSEDEIILSQEDYENLLRIVEAEASGEDETGKLLVANVVLNRVASEDFPDTVTEVIFQRENGVTQFSPVANGRFYTVKISEETIHAVERALSGEDCSQGALYFAARKYADRKNMRWFDENLEFLFSHGGHEFFTG